MAERRRRGAALAVTAVAVGGVALGGYLLMGDGDGPVDPWMPQGTAAVSPPPEDLDDVATDTFTVSETALQITYTQPDEAAGGVVVGAYVAGLIEDGGRCAVTLTLDGTAASAESDGTADASTTSCGQMLVPFAELSPGTWAVDVTYSSPSGGSVAPGHATVEVP